MTAKHLIAIIIHRELRGKKATLIFATAVLMLATILLTLVITLTDTFRQSFEESGKTLLGGDVALRLSQRDFTPPEVQWLQQNSTALSRMRVARVLAYHNQRTQLVRLKGIDQNYPLYGKIGLAETNQHSLHQAAQSPYPAYIGRQISNLFGIGIGDTFMAGGITVKVINIVDTEPDPDPRIWYSAPPIYIAKQILDGPQFNRPGALSARYIRLKLPPDTHFSSWADKVQQQFPQAGWRLSGPDDTQRNVRRTLDRIQKFLALASLAALLLAGIGCGNTASAFLRNRTRSIATLRMLGTNSQLIGIAYMVLISLFTLSGVLIGAAIGLQILPILLGIIAPYLPLPLSLTATPWTIIRAILSVLAIAAAFILPPLLANIRTNPHLLFSNAHDDSTHSQNNQNSDRWVVIATFAAVLLILPLEWMQKLYLLAITAAGVFFYALSLISISFVKKFSHHATVAYRLGALTICRHRRQTAGTIISLSIGIFILVSVMQSESNFSSRIDDTIRQEAPSVFFVGIRPDQMPALTQLITQHDATIRTIPFLRGRVQAIGGRTAEEILQTATEDRWILRGDRGITWSTDGYIGSSTVTQGTLWTDNRASNATNADADTSRLEASFDEEAAIAFGVNIGDEIVINLLGTPVTAIITSLREVDWQSFDINFVIILSQIPIDGIPHTFMGNSNIDKSDLNQLQLQLGQNFPNIIPIPTEPVFAVIKRLLGHIALILKITAILMIISGLPIIISNLIENRQRRVNFVTTLRLIGATRQIIISNVLGEFILIALISVIPAALLGTASSWLIVTHIFELNWQMEWLSLLFITTLCTLAFVLLGAIDTAQILKHPPYEQVRNE